MELWDAYEAFWRHVGSYCRRLRFKRRDPLSCAVSREELLAMKKKELVTERIQHFIEELKQ